MIVEVKHIIIGFIVTLIASFGLYNLVNGYFYRKVQLKENIEVSVSRTPDMVDTIIFFSLIALGLFGCILFVISLIKIIKKDKNQ